MELSNENLSFVHQLSPEARKGALFLLGLSMENATSYAGGTHIDTDNSYPQLNSDEQAAFLMGRYDLMPTNRFVGKGLLVGAQRMDERSLEEGNKGANVSALDRALASEKIRQVYWDGNESVAEPSSLRSHPRKVANLIADNLDPGFNNPIIVYEACGMNPRTGDCTDRQPFVGGSIENFMKNTEWSTELKALMGAVGLHLTAIRLAKQLVSPMLASERRLVTSVKEGFESKFWENKLVGSERTTGVAYYLGYLLKSRELLKDCMKEMWDEDYSRNRNVFVSLATMKTPGLKTKKEKSLVLDQRRLVFGAIANGDFSVAEQGLREIAEQHPNFFGRISLKFLTREK